MKTIDYSYMIVTYNFVVSILLLTSSQKLASYAGAIGFGMRSGVEKYTALAIKAVGGSWAVVSASVLLFVHILGFGVE